jgi:hypothetical protein
MQRSASRTGAIARKIKWRAGVMWSPTWHEGPNRGRDRRTTNRGRSWETVVGLPRRVQQRENGIEIERRGTGAAQADGGGVRGVAAMGGLRPLCDRTECLRLYQQDIACDEQRGPGGARDRLVPRT